MKLNIGCGTDYREGFINIDGSNSVRTDKIIEFPQETLESHFGANSVDYIVAHDFIEHHFHWEAVAILKDFFQVLKPAGQCEIRVPDCEYIIKTWKLDIEQKLTWLFGGQDVPQNKNNKMDESRSRYPQFFCHKYGWTQKRLSQELKNIGFQQIQLIKAYPNFITIATK